MFTCILAGIIFFFAGLLQGLTGFGSALLAIPLLSLLMDIKAAVPLCMLNGLVLTCYLSLHLRTHLDRKRSCRFLSVPCRGLLLAPLC